MVGGRGGRAKLAEIAGLRVEVEKDQQEGKTGGVVGWS